MRESEKLRKRAQICDYLIFIDGQHAQGRVPEAEALSAGLMHPHGYSDRAATLSRHCGFRLAIAANRRFGSAPFSLHTGQSRRK